MRFLELIEKYQNGMRECEMLAIAKSVGAYVSETMNHDAEEKLCRIVFGIISDGHYDKEYAEADIRAMWYENGNGEKQYAPYYTEEKAKEMFEMRKDDLSDYNVWDWWVTLNKIRSDYASIINSCCNKEEEIKMVTNMAICYLQDPDGKDVGHKIWADINR